MVTTIKITCDGVFIQMNSNRLNGSEEEHIESNSVKNVIDSVKKIVKQNRLMNDIDYEPKSLPNLPIANIQPALISPHLVKSISKINKPASTTDKILNLTNISSPLMNKHVENIIRIDKNVHLKPTILSNAHQWDGCVTKKNNSISNNSAVRRRHTFKSYLIECKENIVRRLSTPTANIG